MMQTVLRLSMSAAMYSSSYSESFFDLAIPLFCCGVDEMVRPALSALER